MYLSTPVPAAIAFCDCVSQVGETLYSTSKVKHKITAAYHPQSNGLDERTNQTLKKYDI